MNIFVYPLLDIKDKWDFLAYILICTQDLTTGVITGKFVNHTLGYDFFKNGM